MISGILAYQRRVALLRFPRALIDFARRPGERVSRPLIGRLQMTEQRLDRLHRDGYGRGWRFAAFTGNRSGELGGALTLPVRGYAHAVAGEENHLGPDAPALAEARVVMLDPDQDNAATNRDHRVGRIKRDLLFLADLAADITN